MKTLLLSAIIILGLAGVAVPQDAPAVDTQALVGTWKVDLRPKPGAPEYYQEFVVRKVTEDGFEGTFYKTEIANSRINKNWGTLYVAFTTEDQTGVYHHTAKLVDGRLEGTTHALTRKFLSVWKAERAQKDAKPVS